jgi:hypothetical protein
MKRFLLLLAVAGLALPGWAQFRWVVPPTPEMMDTATTPRAEWINYYMPGPDHTMLERFAGRWLMTEPLGPDSARTIGRSENRMKLDGRLLEIEEFDSAGGQPNHRISYLTYDNFRGQFQFVGMGDRGTGPLFMTGRRDSAFREITLTGTLEIGPRPQAFKTIMRWDSGSWHTFEHWAIAPDGTETKLRTIVYRRMR